MFHVTFAHQWYRRTPRGQRRPGTPYYVKDGAPTVSVFHTTATLAEAEALRVHENHRLTSVEFAWQRIVNVPPEDASVWRYVGTNSRGEPSRATLTIVEVVA